MRLASAAPGFRSAPARRLDLRAVLGGDDDRAGSVVADPLAVPRAHHRDQADQPEDEGVDDQEDAPDEELHHAGPAAVLAYHPQPEQLHPEGLAGVRVR